MMTRFSIACVVVCVAAFLTMLVPARSEVATASGGRDDVRIGLVFDVGGRGDKSFNDSAYAGLDRARREFGVTVEMIEPSGAEDREAAMRLFAARGFDLVLGVGFIFSTDIEVVAGAFPNTSFACVDYAPSSDRELPSNLAGLVFREEEGAFLVGAVAGLVTKTKAVGFVGGMNVPLIRKFEAGYRAGVGHVCSECRVLSAFAGTTPEAFRDPAKGEALATSQYSAGADVVFHASGSTGLGVFEAARDMRAWAIGVDSDQYDEMPGSVLTSMVKRVDVVVYETIRDVLGARFVGGVHVFGVKEGAIGYVNEGPHAEMIPVEVRDKVDGIRDGIREGDIAVGAAMGR
ncbi:MAG: BMP family ABC transporter substrate-binding protein [Polyangiaceae bacterium]|nr:BMP family ABC transporter substrate-binding protein [Polyangiaceae bacterium]